MARVSREPVLAVGEGQRRGLVKVEDMGEITRRTKRSSIKGN